MVALWSGGADRADDDDRPSSRRIGDPLGRQRLGPVLVVDDDTSILDTVSAILTGEGYTVVGATSGEEALDAIARERPGMILLDMRMPGMDGWAVARALRERGVQVPIVVMTAAESAQRWADEVGAAGYLAKPFGLDDLLDVVARHRERGRAN
jgi:CheY-like chemotaxis protein